MSKVRNKKNKRKKFYKKRKKKLSTCSNGQNTCSPKIPDTYFFCACLKRRDKEKKKKRKTQPTEIIPLLSSLSESWSQMCSNKQNSRFLVFSFIPQKRK